MKINKETDWQDSLPLKNLFEIYIPLGKYKKLYIPFYILKNRTGTIKCLKFSIWHLHKMVDYKGYEDEWGTNNWKHYEILRWGKMNKVKKGFKK